MEAYHTKSLMTVFSLLLFSVAIGYLVSMFQGGVTGAVVSLDTVACSDNTQCGDNIVCTIDSCKNAGTLGAFCSNSPVTYCLNNDGCCPAGCAGTDSDCN